MADGFQALSKAFSGIGIDEKSVISLLGHSHPEHRQNFRQGFGDFFTKDERGFERWDDHRIKLLKHEFMRFKNAVVLWAMHPWERDARLLKEALKTGPEAYGVIVEVACTRTADELLGARKAYHSLFDHSIEEDIAFHVDTSERKLLVALVSAYRYEGKHLKDDKAKSDAKKIAHAIQNARGKKPVEDEDVVNILATRSKPHLKAVYKHYKEISGKNIVEDFAADLILLLTIQCICTPHAYFCRVLDTALNLKADKEVRKSLTRVIVTQADRNIKEISEEYQKLYGVSLTERIEVAANGNYKDLLLALLARGN